MPTMYKVVIVFNQCHLQIGIQLFDTWPSRDQDIQQPFYPQNYHNGLYHMCNNTFDLIETNLSNRILYT